MPIWLYKNLGMGQWRASLQRVLETRVSNGVMPVPPSQSTLSRNKGCNACGRQQLKIAKACCRYEHNHTMFGASDTVPWESLPVARSRANAASIIPKLVHTHHTCGMGTETETTEAECGNGILACHLSHSNTSHLEHS